MQLAFSFLIVTTNNWAGFQGKPSVVMYAHLGNLASFGCWLVIGRERSHDPKSWLVIG